MGSFFDTLRIKIAGSFDETEESHHEDKYYDGYKESHREEMYYDGYGADNSKVQKQKLKCGDHIVDATIVRKSWEHRFWVSSNCLFSISVRLLIGKVKIKKDKRKTRLVNRRKRKIGSIRIGHRSKTDDNHHRHDLTV
jgi:hypothetical protein